MYQVLKDFKGSPDGRFAVDYKAGEVVELTTTLAVVAMAEGWVRPVWDEPVNPQGMDAGKSPALKPRKTKTKTSQAATPATANTGN